MPESEELRSPLPGGGSVVPLKETTNRSSPQALQVTACNEVMFSRGAVRLQRQAL